MFFLAFFLFFFYIFFIFYFSFFFIIKGLHVPNLYFVSQPQKNSDSSIAVPRLVRKALRDFAGLDRVDQDIKRALMDFSYYLTIGDMDLAYKAVRK